MKKSRIIVLSLVVALMLVGSVYAAWDQKILVANTSKTGKLELKVTGTAPSGHIYYSGDSADKDASKLVAAASPQALAQVNSGYSNLDIDNVTLTYTGINFFPKTEQRLQFYVKNTGTIPADFELVTDSSRVNMPTDDVKYIIEARKDNKYGPWLTPRAEAYNTALDVVVNNHGTMTLQPGEVAEIWVRLMFNDADETTLEEMHTYDFNMDIVASQFNVD